jgi:hypothetical protein
MVAGTVWQKFPPFSIAENELPRVDRAIDSYLEEVVDGMVPRFPWDRSSATPSA